MAPRIESIFWKGDQRSLESDVLALDVKYTVLATLRAAHSHQIFRLASQGPTANISAHFGNNPPAPESTSVRVLLALTELLATGGFTPDNDYVRWPEISAYFDRALPVLQRISVLLNTF